MDKKKYREGQRDAEAFRKLPERAQEVWFQYCDFSIKNKKLFNMSFIYVMGLDYSKCKSPIEVIFNFAFDLVAYAEGYAGVWLQPQYEVHSRSEDKAYYVDFAFLAEEVDEMIYIKNPSFKLAIECDGHEFHEKTKEQVSHDNEREYDLKMQGYDVLRFSGSQIYNKPLRCAAQTLEYITQKIGEYQDEELSETT